MTGIHCQRTWKARSSRPRSCAMLGSGYLSREGRGVPALAVGALNTGVGGDDAYPGCAVSEKWARGGYIILDPRTSRLSCWRVRGRVSSSMEEVDRDGRIREGRLQGGTWNHRFLWTELERVVFRREVCAFQEFAGEGHGGDYGKGKGL